QRAAQAFEAAESGLEFAIGLLGSGRVDAQCASSDDVALNTFRQRHLVQQPDGTFSTPDLKPTCMLLDGGPNCSCKTAGPPELAVPVGGLAPTFQVHFEPNAQPGLVRVVSRGCSNIGSQCYAGVGNNADAVAEVSVLLGLNSALATPPSAALTVRSALNLNNRAVSVFNSDQLTRGVTIDAGGLISNDAQVRLSSLPGTPGSASVIAGDTSLSELATGDRMFVSLFGMDRDTYRTQPAAVQVQCSADCGVDIGIAVSKNPGRVIWVQGPATISSARVWGTEDEPVTLFVQGDLTISANVQLFGLLYLHGGGGSNTWTTTIGNTMVQGAVVAEGNLLVDGTPTIVFNPKVLRTTSATQGSLVRIPGSWRDFQAGS
ncbi:MAG TPA: hypothetical protein VFK10_18705, partial [Burkholderiaceae bacterium]|nr:hypothetical protein [Burkholderiaceae bacterium]